MTDEKGTTYLDFIDLHAQTAMGRIHDALRRVKKGRGSVASLAEGDDPIHDEMVKILTEAFKAGQADGEAAHGHGYASRYASRPKASR